eukprot:870661-Rhodomonas_salina.3
MTSRDSPLPQLSHLHTAPSPALLGCERSRTERVWPGRHGRHATSSAASKVRPAETVLSLTSTELRARAVLQHHAALRRLDLGAVVGEEEHRLHAQEGAAASRLRAHHHLDDVRLKAPVDRLVQGVEEEQRHVERALPWH